MCKEFEGSEARRRDERVAMSLVQDETTKEESSACHTLPRNCLVDPPRCFQSRRRRAEDPHRSQALAETGAEVPPECLSDPA